MKIHHYDDKYAGANGVNGVKELIAAMCVGCVGIITPVVFMGLGRISPALGLAIIACAAILTVALARRAGLIVSSSMSVLIEGDDALYYLTITPNLRGSSLPRSVTAALAGSSAIFAENNINAEIEATGLAQNDDFILYLFNLYQEDKIKMTFDTVMYGKPVTVYKLLDRDFNRTDKKVYRVKCVKNKKKRMTVKIPRVFPTFFE